MKREISLDTETTGLNAFKGDRLVEIGCVEMIDHIATDKYFHCYINPLREVPDEAVKIHNLTTEFLSDKPVFDEIADKFLDFIGDSELVIHNAPFDMGFINNELGLSGRELISMDRVTDTLVMAKQMFPGGDSKSLDALCRKFSIDNSSRTKHGALLDAQLLAEVYLELKGGREPSFIAGVKKKNINIGNNQAMENINREYHKPRDFPLSTEEINADKDFLSNLKDAIWNKIK